MPILGKRYQGSCGLPDHQASEFARLRVSLTSSA
jgi:hypothetical protein